MVIRGPLSTPSYHKQPLCGYTEPLCGSIPLQKLLENNFKGPIFISPPPPSKHKLPLWAYGTTVWVNFPEKATRNHCVGYFSWKNYWKTTLGPHVYQGSSSPFFTTQTTIVWAHGTTVWVNSSVKTTRNHCVGQFIWKNYWKTTFRFPGFPLLPFAPQTISVWAYGTTVDRQNHCVD